MVRVFYLIFLCCALVALVKCHPFSGHGQLVEFHFNRNQEAKKLDNTVVINKTRDSLSNIINKILESEITASGSNSTSKNYTSTEENRKEMPVVQEELKVAEDQTVKTEETTIQKEELNVKDKLSFLKKEVPAAEIEEKIVEKVVEKVEAPVEAAVSTEKIEEIIAIEVANSEDDEDDSDAFFGNINNKTLESEITASGSNSNFKNYTSTEENRKEMPVVQEELKVAEDQTVKTEETAIQKEELNVKDKLSFLKQEVPAAEIEEKVVAEDKVVEKVEAPVEAAVSTEKIEEIIAIEVANSEDDEDDSDAFFGNINNKTLESEITASGSNSTFKNYTSTEENRKEMPVVQEELKVAEDQTVKTEETAIQKEELNVKDKLSFLKKEVPAAEIEEKIVEKVVEKVEAPVEAAVSTEKIEEIIAIEVANSEDDGDDSDAFFGNINNKTLESEITASGSNSTFKNYTSTEENRKEMPVVQEELKVAEDQTVKTEETAIQKEELNVKDKLLFLKKEVPAAEIEEKIVAEDKVVEKNVEKVEAPVEAAVSTEKIEEIIAIEVANSEDDEDDSDAFFGNINNKTLESEITASGSNSTFKNYTSTEENRKEMPVVQEELKVAEDQTVKTEETAIQKEELNVKDKLSFLKKEVPAAEIEEKIVAEDKVVEKKVEKVEAPVEAAVSTEKIEEIIAIEVANSEDDEDDSDAFFGNINNKTLESEITASGSNSNFKNYTSTEENRKEMPVVQEELKVAEDQTVKTEETAIQKEELNVKDKLSFLKQEVPAAEIEEKVVAEDKVVEKVEAPVEAAVSTEKIEEIIAIEVANSEDDEDDSDAFFGNINNKTLESEITASGSNSTFKNYTSTEENRKEMPVVQEELKVAEDQTVKTEETAIQKEELNVKDKLSFLKKEVPAAEIEEKIVEKVVEKVEAPVEAAVSTEKIEEIIAIEVANSEDDGDDSDAFFGNINNKTLESEITASGSNSTFKNYTSTEENRKEMPVVQEELKVAEDQTVKTEETAIQKEELNVKDKLLFLKKEVPAAEIEEKIVAEDKVVEKNVEKVEAPVEAAVSTEKIEEIIAIEVANSEDDEDDSDAFFGNINNKTLESEITASGSNSTFKNYTSTEENRKEMPVVQEELKVAEDQTVKTEETAIQKEELNVKDKLSFLKKEVPAAEIEEKIVAEDKVVEKNVEKVEAPVEAAVSTEKIEEIIAIEVANSEDDEDDSDAFFGNINNKTLESEITASGSNSNFKNYTSTEENRKEMPVVQEELKVAEDQTVKTEETAIQKEELNVKDKLSFLKQEVPAAEIEEKVVAEDKVVEKVEAPVEAAVSTEKIEEIIAIEVANSEDDEDDSDAFFGNINNKTLESEITASGSNSTFKNYTSTEENRKEMPVVQEELKVAEDQTVKTEETAIQKEELNVKDKLSFLKKEVPAAEIEEKIVEKVVEKVEAPVEAAVSTEKIEEIIAIEVANSEDDGDDSDAFFGNINNKTLESEITASGSNSTFKNYTSTEENRKEMPVVQEELKVAEDQTVKTEETAIQKEELNVKDKLLFLKKEVPAAEIEEKIVAEDKVVEKNVEKVEAPVEAAVSTEKIEEIIAIEVANSEDDEDDSDAFFGNINNKTLESEITASGSNSTFKNYTSTEENRKEMPVVQEELKVAEDQTVKTEETAIQKEELNVKDKLSFLKKEVPAAEIEEKIVAEDKVVEKNVEKVEAPVEAAVSTEKIEEIIAIEVANSEDDEDDSDAFFGNINNKTLESEITASGSNSNFKNYTSTEENRKEMPVVQEELKVAEDQTVKTEETAIQKEELNVKDKLSFLKQEVPAAEIEEKVVAEDKVVEKVEAPVEAAVSTEKIEEIIAIEVANSEDDEDDSDAFFGNRGGSALFSLLGR